MNENLELHQNLHINVYIGIINNGQNIGKNQDVI